MTTNLKSPNFSANVLWYLVEISLSLLYFSFPLKRVKTEKKTTMLIYIQDMGLKSYTMNYILIDIININIYIHTSTSQKFGHTF